MAEKPCDLLKNGGGTDRVQLRATATNSGGQTRRDVIATLYSAIKNAYDEDNSRVPNMFIVLNFPNNLKWYARGQSYDNNTFGFVANSVTYTGTFFINFMGISISSTGAQIRISSIYDGASFTALADDGGGTDIVSAQLYY